MFSYLKRIHYQAHRATEHDWMYKIETINTKIEAFQKLIKQAVNSQIHFTLHLVMEQLLTIFYQIF